MLRDAVTGAISGAKVGTFSPKRLRSGKSALCVGLQMEGVSALQRLRDEVLSGEADINLNRILARGGFTWELQVDKAQFFEMYEAFILKSCELTKHQEEKLNRLETADGDVHLSAPAGAGKTFVALQTVLNALMRSNNSLVVYAAPSFALSFFFIQWLATRLSLHYERQEAELRSMVSRLRLLLPPYKMLLTAQLNDGIIETSPARDCNEINNIDLVVLDEAHQLFSTSAKHTEQLQQILSSRARKLFLSDESQSSAVRAKFPHVPCRVQLTEVVRSTKRIVAGAASFQLLAESGEPTASASTDGPPLKVFLFDQKDHSYDAYAAHLLKALQHVTRTFQGVSWHRRLAVLGPNEDFVAELKPILEAKLCQELLHRRVRLTTFEESLKHLSPYLQSSRQEDLEEWIVFDSLTNADGLEQLVVIAVGLDAPLTQGQGDLQTRAGLYRAITRAQLLAIVVNAHVPGGWLEFLSTVRFEGAGKLPDHEEVPLSPKAASEARDEALRNLKESSESSHDASRPNSEAHSDHQEDAMEDSMSAEKEDSVSTEDAQELQERKQQDEEGKEREELAAAASRPNQPIQPKASSIQQSKTANPTKPAERRQIVSAAKPTKPAESRQIVSSVWDTSDSKIEAGELRFNPLAVEVRSCPVARRCYLDACATLVNPKAAGDWL